MTKEKKTTNEYMDSLLKRLDRVENLDKLTEVDRALKRVRERIEKLKEK